MQGDVAGVGYDVVEVLLAPARELVYPVMLHPARGRCTHARMPEHNASEAQALVLNQLPDT